MEWNNIHLEKYDEGWAILTIQRPKVLNALNAETLAELEQALDRVESSPEIRALVVTGAGEKAFVAGADIKELRAIEEADRAEELSGRGQQLFNRIEELSIPVVMAVNGFALGGGFELALSGDILLASDKARFGLPEVNLGILPGYGGTQRLARVVGNSTAKYYALTGEMIPADEAFRLGIVQKVISPDQLLKEAKQLAQKLSKQAPVAMKYIKKAINQGAEADLKTGLQLESSFFGILFNTDDRLEGMDAFLEKRKANFSGK